MQNQIPKLSSESSKNYELFCNFASLGNRRNIAKFADENRLSRQHIYNISNKNNWVSRLEEIDKTTRNKISTATLEKLVSIQNGEMELLISSYESLQIAIKLANRAIQAFDPAEYDFEHILKITSNFINQMNKYQKVNDLLERKLEKFDIFLTDQKANQNFAPTMPNESNEVKDKTAKSKPLKPKNQLKLNTAEKKTLPAPKPTQELTEKKLSEEEIQKIETIEKELQEINIISEGKPGLKSMGHTKVRKLHKRKKELLLQLSNLQKN